MISGLWNLLQQTACSWLIVKFDHCSLRLSVIFIGRGMLWLIFLQRLGLLKNDSAGIGRTIISSFVCNR